MARHSMNASLLAVIFTLVCCASGCTENADEGPRAKSDVTVYLDPQQTPSAHDQISTGDLAQFISGKAKDEILRGVQWRGTFFMAAAIENKPTSAILFNVVPPHAEEDELGVWVYAIFEDSNFVKFVQHPFMADVLEKLPAELLEEVKLDGEKRYPRIRPMKIGDAALLEFLANAEPLGVDALKKQAEGTGTAPRQIDPGLTVAFLGLKAMGIDPIQNVGEDYQLNAKLRDQFNGARLSVGMSDERVEEVFGSKLIETGKAEPTSFLATRQTVG